MSGRTLPPPPATRLPAELKARSMERYGKPVEEVEEEYLSLIHATDENNINPDPEQIRRRKIT